MKAAIVAFISVISLSGCSINLVYRNERTTKTYGYTTVKEIKMSEKSCTVVVDPPSLGEGQVNDVNLEDCKRIKIGDSVMVHEATINSKHSARMY